MKINKRLVVRLLHALSFSGVLLLASVVQRRDPILLDNRGGVQVWLEPQPAPLNGFGAAKVFLRTTDPEAKLITFAYIAIDGELVQQFVPGLGRSNPTPFVDSEMPVDWLNVPCIPEPNSMMYLGTSVLLLGLLPRGKSKLGN